MYGIEMWGLYEEWEKIDKIHCRFCKIILGVSRFSANNMAELELGRDSRRGKVLSMIAKYWLCLLHTDSLEIIKMYHEWQINNLKVEGSANKLKGELEEIGRLAYCHMCVTIDGVWIADSIY
jgi:hypothetical protein